MVLGPQDANRTVISVQSPGHSEGTEGSEAASHLPLQDFTRLSHHHRHGDQPSASVRQETSPETALGKAPSLPEIGSAAAQHNGVTDCDEAEKCKSSRGEISPDTVTAAESKSPVNCSVPQDDSSTGRAASARRISRKTGVYVLPSPPVVREQDGEQVLTFTDTADDSVKPVQSQPQADTRSAVRIVVTAESDMAEADSGVDTETHSPLSHPSPSFTTAQAALQEIEEESSSVNNNTEGEDEDKDRTGSRGLPQQHPVYEKNPVAQKTVRKVSLESSTSPVHKHSAHLSGATRRISQHKRKVSVGSDSNNSSTVVPSRKNSMVLIEQIPQIIQESLQRYLQVPDPNHYMEENEDMAGSTPARPQRVSVFSINTTNSRRSSNQSDVTFWDPQEMLPYENHYHLVMDQHGNFRPRPTLYQLREEPESPTRPTPAVGEDLKDDPDAEEGQVKKPKVSPKQGWIQGVLVRCLLNIFGVMLFLRLTWITGQAGIGLGTVVVLLASVVTTLTTMSMAAICTNGEVRGGGAYYMISRSLGPEFGGAIGMIFSLANAVAAAMYVVGFAETLRDLVKDNGATITGDPLHDVRVIGVGVSLLLLGVVMIGLDFESKAQLVLLVVLIISIINYFIGTFLPPDEEKKRAGFVGYTGEVFLNNVGPDFREYDGITYDFFTIFAIFFPAATGILAGANISGDLKNPSSAIPKGTFLAIFITTLVYVLSVLSTGSCMLRDAIGTASPAPLNVSLAVKDIEGACAGVGNITCPSGLHNSRSMMGIASAFEPLIYAGIFSATLSSALASIVSAPKVFQALGKDKLFPFIGFFAKGYGKNGEPKRGYFLTFFICVGMTCIGSLDIIAPIISNFFLMAYALINFSCFDAAMANSPGFRPSFRMFNKWCSLLGALLCAVIMFMVSWWAALITVIAVTALYVYLKNTKPDVNWGSSGQAHAYNDALRSTSKLVHVEEHVKNFRPQILVLTGYPRNRPDLVDFANTIAKRQNLLICAQVFQGDMVDHLARLRSTAAYRWFQNRKVNAFYSSVAAPTVRHGAQALLQSQGLGKLRPNTLLLGFKNNWQVVDPRKVHNYAGIIHDAFDLNYGVGVLRLPNGMDTHKVADSLLDSTDDTLDNVNTDTTNEDISEAEVQFEIARKRRMSTVVTERPNMPISPVTDIALRNLQNQYQQATAKRTYMPDDDDENYDDDETDYDDEDSEDEEENEKSSRRKKATKKKTKSKEAAKEDETDDPERRESKQNGSPRVLKSVLSRSESKAGYFRGKQSGTIDVWWLFDDGGLGLLIPHVLSSRKKWKDCRLRVFCTGTKKSNLEEDQIRMEGLLRKFRIDYSDITVLSDLTQKPRKSSYKEFEELIYQWRLCPGETQEEYPWKVSDADLASHKNKIYMQIKIREKLLEHSKEATLIVVTLPVPRKFCPAGLYMTWLDTLTRDLPPTLLLRGNQQSVLTYFS
ncbi:solute carrier family 12 member 1-like [Babylonia areolata]|uniref:solute carrier family 12 member 1-like n=1 Tax=Babylonia areolata TaxID=304850 RepID=UPI003FD5836F